MSEFEEKVLEMLKKIDDKLNNILGAGSKAAEPAPKPAQKPAEAVSGPAPTVKPSAVAEKQEEEAKAIVKPPVEGRRVCPSCGSTDFQAVEDKSKVLHQMGGIKIYAKIYKCKKCGKEL